MEIKFSDQEVELQDVKNIGYRKWFQGLDRYSDPARANVEETGSKRMTHEMKRDWNAHPAPVAFPLLKEVAEST